MMGISDFSYFILIEIKFVSCSETVSDSPARSYYITCFSLIDFRKFDVYLARSIFPSLVLFSE